ncbi:MAG: phosphatidate cytidylyltransferase [Thermoguttaceae bacterium]|nr:phosphatidate cytidylyltransferase [Thermoguttaceae bacterium]
MGNRAILLILGILVLLIAVTAIVGAIRHKIRSVGNPLSKLDLAIFDTYMSRIQVWWVLFGLLACAVIAGTVTTVFFFFILSLWAWREYTSTSPTNPADHRTLFFVAFFWAPLQFFLVGINDEWFTGVFGISSYQIFSILVPAYALFLLPAGVAISGTPDLFRERIVNIQTGLLFCVYAMSFAPALLTMHIPNERHEETVTPAVFEGGVEEKVLAPLSQAIEGAIAEQAAPESDAAQEAAGAETDEEPKPETITDVLRRKPLRKQITSERICLLCVFFFIVQMSDVFQHLWSLFFRRGVIAKNINMNKTWGGVLAGAFSTALLTMGLRYFLPLPKWWQPLVLGFAVSLMGFAGSITFSAIKREREQRRAEEKRRKSAKSYFPDERIVLLEGHNSVLDRIDSLCFAAPIYYHLVWIFVNVDFRFF